MAFGGGSARARSRQGTGRKKAGKRQGTGREQAGNKQGTSRDAMSHNILGNPESFHGKPKPCQKAVGTALKIFQQRRDVRKGRPRAGASGMGAAKDFSALRSRTCLEAGERTGNRVG